MASVPGVKRLGQQPPSMSFRMGFVEPDAGSRQAPSAADAKINKEDTNAGFFPIPKRAIQLSALAPLLFFSFSAVYVYTCVVY